MPSYEQGQMYCQTCDNWFWPDHMATDNDGKYIEQCQECFMRPVGPMIDAIALEQSEYEDAQDMEDMLETFGWTASEEFWKKYDTDPWVFNLANALRGIWREQNAPGE